jgi:hypothetical protein
MMEDAADEVSEISSDDKNEMPDEVFVNIADNHNLYKKDLEREIRLADETAQIALE